MNLFANVSDADLISAHRKTKADYLKRRKRVSDLNSAIKSAEAILERVLQNVPEAETVRELRAELRAFGTYTNQEQETKLLTRECKRRGFQATTDGNGDSYK